MRGVDTSLLVRYVTRDEPGQARKVRELRDDAAGNGAPPARQHQGPPGLVSRGQPSELHVVGATGFRAVRECGSAVHVRVRHARCNEVQAAHHLLRDESAGGIV